MAPPARAERRPGLGHSLDRTPVSPPSAGVAAGSSPAATASPARVSPAGVSPGRPIQALFSRDDVARYWRTAKSYLNPFNTFGRRTRAASHYGEETDDVAAEVDRSLRVVSPARLLLRGISPRHRNRPDEVTRSDRDEINRLIQDVHAQGLGLGAPATGLRISTGFIRDAHEKAETRLETTRDLIRIARTRSGRELLRSLHARGRGGGPRVSIESQREADIDDPNAGRADPSDTEALSRGRPSGSSVFYIPSGLRDLRGRRPDRLNPWNDPARGDVSLYHELVHAHHSQRGGARDTHAADSLPAITRQERRHRLDKGVPREEYRTVGLSRRYRGDRVHENRYRRELRELGEDVAERTTYNLIEPEDAERETGRASTSTGETSRLLDSDEDD